MERALCCTRFQPSGVPQKQGLSCACVLCRACVLCLPRLSGSGSQELDRHNRPGCSAPSPLRVPSPSRTSRLPVPCVSQRPSQQMSTIQNLRKSLVRNWSPVCSAVGDAVLGAEPAPFPSLLRPASSGAGPVSSLRALLWTCSVPLFCERLAVCSGRLIFSLSCYPTV